jgi:hypothetical protein
VGATGFEHYADFTEKTPICRNSAAESGAVLPKNDAAQPNDQVQAFPAAIRGLTPADSRTPTEGTSDLAATVDAQLRHARLPEAIRAVILTLIRAATISSPGSNPHPRISEPTRLTH